MDSTSFGHSTQLGELRFPRYHAPTGSDLCINSHWNVVILKHIDILCGDISSSVHIQNLPLRHQPFLGYEETNQIIDLVYILFNLGMEDQLLDVLGGRLIERF